VQDSSSKRANVASRRKDCVLCANSISILWGLREHPVSPFHPRRKTAAARDTGRKYSRGLDRTALTMTVLPYQT
jgi:hypothetical protein